MTTPPKPDMFDKIESTLDETDRARFTLLLAACLDFGALIGVIAAVAFGAVAATVGVVVTMAIIMGINWHVTRNRAAFNEWNRKQDRRDGE